MSAPDLPRRPTIGRPTPSPSATVPGGTLVTGGTAGTIVRHNALTGVERDYLAALAALGTGADASSRRPPRRLLADGLVARTADLTPRWAITAAGRAALRSGRWTVS